MWSNVTFSVFTAGSFLPFVIFFFFAIWCLLVWALPTASAQPGNVRFAERPRMTGPNCRCFVPPVSNQPQSVTSCVVPRSVFTDGSFFPLAIFFFFAIWIAS